MGKRKASSPPTVTKLVKMNEDGSSDQGGWVNEKEDGDVGRSITQTEYHVAPEKASATEEYFNRPDFETCEMRELNKNFIKECGSSVESDPSVCLVPLMKNYLSETHHIMTCQTAKDFRNRQQLVSFARLGEYYEKLERELVGDNGVEDGTSGNLMDYNNALTHSVDSSTSVLKDKVERESKQVFGKAEKPVEFQSRMNKTEFLQSIQLVEIKPKKDLDGGIRNGFTAPAFGTGFSSNNLSALSNGIKEDAPIFGAMVSKGFNFNPPPIVPVASSSGASLQESQESENGEDEPEPYEVKQVVESDSLYSVRCKVFGILDGQYKDKGVGQLYIKKLESGKHQAVVRADNNLGTILLNILLHEAVPLNKKSPKDIMTMDPLGDGGKPMSILLRVKSEEEATTLMERLEEFSKLSS